MDRIGPCEARIFLEKVEDVREEKRKAIMTKAKDILRKWVVESSPSTEEVVKEVAGSLRGVDVISYGPEQLPAGPEVDSGSLILVEGRADVILLMKCGIKNVIALNGTKVPDTIIKLTKDKEVTAFLDGDRAGDLILKELTQVADIDYVARATFGKEVEELTPKEIMRALRERVPINLAKPIERTAYTRPERMERPERSYTERPYSERPYIPTPEAPPPTPALQKPNLPGPIFDIAKDTNSLDNWLKELKLPQNFTGAWEVIQRGREMLIDAPWANYISEGRARWRVRACTWKAQKLLHWDCA